MIIRPELIKKIKSNKIISPKELGGYYYYALHHIIRCYPLKAFDTTEITDEQKKSIVRYLIDPRDVIGSIRKVSCEYLPGSNTNFLWFCIRFDHIKTKLEELYLTMNTWSIADYLYSNQSAIRRIYGPDGLGVSNRSMRSSKIHKDTKPIIESILGPTESEYYHSGYWLDEYSDRYKLDIEIDGKWCHDQTHDKKRDAILNSKGIKVIRIEAYSDPESIKSILLDAIKCID